MPTVIAIEAKLLEARGINAGFHHLYLVKTETDDTGRVLSEKVIRGTLGNGGELETLANADLATSPDARGSDTVVDRHRRELDLGGRDADDVWKVMVKHAQNIDRANLDYSVDIFGRFDGGDINSNSVVASVMFSVGINWSTNYPFGISRSEAPLFGQLAYMNVNDGLYGTARNDTVQGGVGNDNLHAGGGNDLLAGGNGIDRLYGALGDDRVTAGGGDDLLSGGSGADILRGGVGQDAFLFNTLPDGTISLDTIRDFSVANDTIWLDNRIFTEAGPEGRLKSWLFWTGSVAHDATDRIIYDSADGVLYYDPDGTGATTQVAITNISTGLNLTYADFRIV
jgi:Ca2+-binding RTX toxin-like protein